MTYYPNHDNLYPAEDDGYSVGSPSARWKDGYFGPDSLHLATTIAETGTARDWAFTVDGSGNLVLRESSVRKLFLDTDGKLALNAGAANEQLTIDGKLSLVEGSAPTATSGYGKVYAKSSDSKLYFLSAGGTEYDLTASGTPASGDGYVQFNNAGVFGSDVTFYWNNTTKQLSIGSNSPNERLTVSGAVSLAEGSAPSATSGFGKIYIKSSDSKLYFKDDSGTEFDLTAGGASGAAGLVQLSDGASNFTSDSGFKYSADHLSVLGSTKLTKPVSVGETINVYGNSISLSADTNQGAVARAVGIVATYNQTVFNQAISSFTAGVAGVSQPIIGVGSSVSGQWAAGDIIQVSGSPQNDGLYEIEGIGGGLNVTIKGVGTVDTTENFTRRQFVTTTGESASAFKVIVSSLRSGTDGNWEQGKGSAAPLTYADLSTGSVAAAGSSGAVQFNASGALAADDTNFFWDDTNNFLGLGVNTPGARLHVAGSSIIDASALSAQSGMDLYSNPGIDGDNNVVLSVLASTSMAANVGGGIAFGGRYTSGGAFAGWAGIKGIKEDATSGNLAASLVFTTRANASNVTEQMRLNSAGYLSIGTTSAIERLAVSGAIAIAEATAPSATSGYGKVYVKSSDSKLYFKDDGGTEFDLTAGASVAGSSGAVQFNSSGSLGADTSNFFWDDTNNRLGIGTSTPASTVDIQSTAAEVMLHIINNTPGNWVQVVTERVDNATQEVAYILKPAGTLSSGNPQWYMEVPQNSSNFNITTYDGSSLVNRMTILTGGNVGIADTNPNEKLTLSGVLSIAEGSAPSATSGYGKVYVKSSDSKLYFKDDGGTEYDLTAGGGGGTPAGSTGAIQFNSSGSFGADTSNLFWDDTNNRLGIRTSSPSHMLHMVGGVLPANEKALFISASLDNNEECYRIQAVSTGSSGSKRVGLVHLQAGYTGSDDAVTTVTICEAVSAGVSFDPVTGAVTTGGAFAVRNEAYGSSSSGYNFGAFNWAANGLLSVGSRNTIGHSGFANNGFVQDSLNIGSINAISLSKHASSTTERHYGSTSSAAGGDFNIGAISGLGLTKTGIEAYSFSAAHVFDNGAVSAPIWVALDNGSEVARLADGGNLGLGVSSPNERLTISGVLSIAEGTAPSATSGYGKIYVKSADSKLYFQNDSGTEYDLTAGGGGGTPAGSSGAIQFNSAGSFGADGYLFWDDTNNYLGVGTSTPNSTMDVRGSVSKAFSVKTTNYTLTDLDYSLFVNANSGSITISLPAASTCAGRVYVVKKIDSSSNNVVLDADGSELIDSISSFTLIVQNQSVTVQSDGSGWWII